MAIKYRWVLEPLVLVNGVRVPKCNTLEDPGRPPKQFTNGLGETKTQVFKYGHSSVIDDVSGTHCLSLVSGEDFSALDADSDIVNIFDETFDRADEASHKGRSMRERGWNAAQEAQLRNKLRARNIPELTITRDSTYSEILERVAQTIHPGTGAEGIKF